MTNIFSSKSQLAELKAENEQLKATVSDVTAKLESAKTLTQDLAELKQQFGKEKTEWNTAVETMKSEFSTAVESLKQQIADITKQKAEVEQAAKAEVAKASEVNKEEVKAQVMEGVAVKVASMGITEADLPKTPKAELAEKIRIVRY